MVELCKLSPEVAGQLGHATVVGSATEGSRSDAFPNVTKLEYMLNGWLGDELLESYPCFIVAERLGKALSAAGLSGLKFVDVKITTSELFRELYPRRKLPSFRWLVPEGRVRLSPDDVVVIEWTGHDLCLSQKAQLVVTTKALNVLQQFSLEHCKIEKLADRTTSNAAP